VKGAAASAHGTSLTSLVWLTMSALEGKANLLFRPSDTCVWLHGGRGYAQRRPDRKPIPV